MLCDDLDFLPAHLIFASEASLLGTRTAANGIMVWAWMLWSPCTLRARTELWFGHGCSGHRMLLESERNCGLGMDALVAICSWKASGTVVWAWMLWSS